MHLDVIAAGWFDAGVAFGARPPDVFPIPKYDVNRPKRSADGVVTGATVFSATIFSFAFVSVPAIRSIPVASVCASILVLCGGTSPDTESRAGFKLCRFCSAMISLSGFILLRRKSGYRNRKTSRITL